MCINWFIRSLQFALHVRVVVLYIGDIYIYFIYIRTIYVWWLGQTPEHPHTTTTANTKHKHTDTESEFSAAEAAAPMTAFQKLNSYIFQRHGDA